MPIEIDIMETHPSSSDVTAVMLRGHLWTEAALTDLVKAGLEFPDEWRELDRLPFPSKVSLAVAMGICEPVRGLTELNRIRNKLAHNPRFEIDGESVMGLARSLSDDFDGRNTPYDLSFFVAWCVDRPPVMVVRTVILFLIRYLAMCATDALQIRRERLRAQTERARSLAAEFDQQSRS